VQPGEASHECLAIRVARKLKAIDVIDILSDRKHGNLSSASVFAP
jgi:hypothetical protein